MKKIVVLLFTICFVVPLGWTVPAAITDFTVIKTGFQHVRLSWSTPNDSGAGATPSNYEIRVATPPTQIVSTDTWNNHSGIIVHPYRIYISTSGVTAGQSVSVTITGLTNNQGYYFAIKSSTDNVNWSALDTSDPEPYSQPFNSQPGKVGGHNLEDAVMVNTSTPTLSWGVPGLGSDDVNYGDSIASYTVELSTDINFTIKLSKDSIGTTSWISYPLDENTTYYWRVKGIDTEGLESDGYLGQTDKRFVVNAVNEPPLNFNLTDPVNFEIQPLFDYTPQFTWEQTTDPDPDNNVVTYTLFYSTTSDFDVAYTTTEAGVTSPCQSSYNLIENATYYWKIHALDNTSAYTVSSSTGTLRINAVNQAPNAFNLLSPADGVEISTYVTTLTWEPTIDEDPGNTLTYTLLYSSSDPNLALANCTAYYNLTVTQLDTITLYEDTTYWWKVQAIDQSFMSTETATWSFYVDVINVQPNAFNLVTSSGLINTSQPVLDWEDSVDPDNDAVTYTIYYATDEDFSVYSSSAGLIISSYVPTVALNENTTYYWKVEAYDINLQVRASSQIWSFLVDALQENPSSFDLTSPQDGAVFSYFTPSLDWEDSTSDPDPGDYVLSYTLYYSTLSDLSSATEISSLAISTYTFTSALSNNTTYYWRVKALSYLSGQTTTQIRSFSIVNCAPAAFDLINSSSIIYTDTILLDWEDAVDPENDTVYYTVYYSSFSDFSVSESTAGHSASNCTISNLADNTTYYWYVNVVDQWGSQKQQPQVTSYFHVNHTDESPLSFTLASPVSGTTLDTLYPELSWSTTTDPDMGNSVTYILWYSSDSAFSYKEELAMQTSTSYTFTSNIWFGTTYYWRVYAVGSDGQQRVSDTWNFIGPAKTIPQAPTNLTTTFNADGTRVTLSWSAPTKNIDGTDVDNIAGYKIYTTDEVENIFSVAPIASVGVSTLSWTEDKTVNQVLYYAVRAYNTWGDDGLFSDYHTSIGPNVDIAYPDDRSVIITYSTEVVPSTMTIEVSRNTDEEDDDVLGSYVVSARDANQSLVDYTFSQPVTITFKLSKITAARHRAPKSAGDSFNAGFAPISGSSTTGVFWNNSTEWIRIKAQVSSSEIVVQTLHTGSYQLRTVHKAVEFTTLEIYPKIITPNGDGKNDEFNCTFENPTSNEVDGYIYSLNGTFIANMEEKLDYWYIWGGKDDSGQTVVPGIYIYQIKCGTKLYNGTVVVAR